MIEYKKYLKLSAGLLVLWIVLQAILKKTHFQKMKAKQIGIDVFRQLLNLGFYPETAKYILAQAVHETGNFESKIFRENNNLFGMKVPKVRKTTAQMVAKYGHAVYNSIEDSITDYSMYWNAREMPAIFPTIASFVALLKKKAYFEDQEGNYLKGVINAYNVYFNEN